MKFTKWQLAVGIVALVTVAATTAYATHVFNDVEDGRFYAEPAEWAADNGITNGCGNGNFCPNDPVTRGENITFAKRYDDNIVHPALSAIESDISSLQAADNIEHGAIVMHHGAGDWFPNGGTGGSLTVARFTNTAEFSGGGGVQSDIEGPMSIDGQAYDLDSVTYCINTITGTATITSVQLRKGGSVIATDSTVRAIGDSGCVTLDVDTTADAGMLLYMVTTSGGDVRIDELRSTWVPRELSIMLSEPTLQLDDTMAD